MKFFLTMAFFIAISANNAIWSELQQKQLTKEISMQYEQMEQKGDESKKEILLKNPHFFWMDTSSMTPTIAAEVNHKGLLKILIDRQQNRIETQSDGSTRVRINPNDNDQSVDFTIEGKIIKIINIDFQKADPALTKMKAGEMSDQNLLTVLNAIKSASSEGKDLKLYSESAGNEPTLIEWFKGDYVQSSGETPENFTLKFKIKQNLEYVGSQAIYRFPDVNPIDSTYEMKLNLADWSKLLDFARKDRKHLLPAGTFDIKSESKTKISETSWQTSFASKKLEDNKHAIEGKMHYEAKSTSDWVKKIQNIQKEPKKESGSLSPYAFIEPQIVDWIKSPRTTPFLSLFPLILSSDWNGSLQYSSTDNFSVEKGNFTYSLMGKEKNGLKANLNYENGNYDSAVALVGGRADYDYGIDLYNAFSDSLPQFQLKKFSKENRDDLFKVLSKYAEQPEKAASELKFNLHYDKDQQMLKIQNKNFEEFANDLSDFYQRFTNQPSAGQGSDEAGKIYEDAAA